MSDTNTTTNQEALTMTTETHTFTTSTDTIAFETGFMSEVVSVHLNGVEMPLKFDTGFAGLNGAPSVEAAEQVIALRKAVDTLRMEQFRRNPAPRWFDGWFRGFGKMFACAHRTVTQGVIGNEQNGWHA